MALHQSAFYPRSSEAEGHTKPDLSFKILLGSPVRDRFPSISVSVTLLSILIKYVSCPRAFAAAPMETSNGRGSNRKSEEEARFILCKWQSSQPGVEHCEILQKTSSIMPLQKHILRGWRHWSWDLTLRPCLPWDMYMASDGKQSVKVQAKKTNMRSFCD